MTRILTIAKDKARQATSSILALAMPEAINMFSPSGGVEKPTPQQHTRMTPKWMGSTPYACMTGSSTGVTSKMIARVQGRQARGVAGAEQDEPDEGEPGDFFRPDEGIASGA